MQQIKPFETRATVKYLSLLQRRKERGVHLRLAIESREESYSCSKKDPGLFCESRDGKRDMVRLATWAGSFPKGALLARRNVCPMNGQ
jgi:hypothetical protein